VTRARISTTLSTEQADAFGKEIDLLRQEVVADLGQKDVDHIRNVVRAVRYTEAGGRFLLHFGIDPVSFGLGAALLGVSKILENMEVGHNVMHGQYDWSKDPALDSRTYEWDTACTGDDWRHSHNYEHHTFTNVLGKDRDIGYGFLRMTDAQPWNLSHAFQPITASLLAVFFQWGVAAHDLRIDETLAGRQPLSVLRCRAQPLLRKASWQLAKDYAFFPALALGNAPRVFLGNALASVARNLWTFSVIFCGHFPEGVRVYEPHEAENESRGAWYLRQLNGSANIEGGRWLHLFTGHLSHQIEHHLFPDLPAARYPELAPRVREICDRYGQAYNTGSFAAQLATVVQRIVAFARPSGGISGHARAEAS
jgi:NADPH-dependent stearoyl-CoA 9-desaturase